MHDHVTNQFHSFVEYSEKLYVIIIRYCVSIYGFITQTVDIITYSFSTSSYLVILTKTNFQVLNIISTVHTNNK